MAMVRTLEYEMNMAIDNIKFEDDARCLYFLNRVECANVKLPTLSGEQSEDGQATKLIKCLESHTKSLIPL